jgi:hypothetical protein
MVFGRCFRGLVYIRESTTTLAAISERGDHLLSPGAVADVCATAATERGDGEAAPAARGGTSPQQPGPHWRSATLVRYGKLPEPGTDLISLA